MAFAFVVAWAVLALLLVLWLVAVVWVHLTAQSPFHTRRTARSQFFINVFMRCFGRYRARAFRKACNNANQEQSTFLTNLIQNAAHTQYGQDHRFAEIHSVAQFQQLHPLTRYDQFEPYIETLRHTAGPPPTRKQKHLKKQPPILTAKPVVLFAITSGTSGAQRVLPVVKPQQTNFFLYGIAPVLNAMHSAWPTLKTSLCKSAKFMFMPATRPLTPAGLPQGPSSSTPINSKRMMALYATPMDGYELLDEPSAIYVQLLFALRDPTLVLLEANFASMILHAFRVMEERWHDLVADIRRGTLHDNIVASKQQRTAIQAHLRADLKRATQLNAIFQQHKAKRAPLAASALWPNLQAIVCVTSGSFHVYFKLLRKWYAPHVPIFSPIYAATEGLLGINLDVSTALASNSDQPIAYTLVPNAMFYEFIPIACADQQQPHTLISADVRIGQVYELVVTTVGGLYRYRFGDVVKVVGRDGQAVRVEFQYRHGQLLNVRGEKTSEIMMLRALEEWLRQYRPCFVLQDYACADFIFSLDKKDGELSPSSGSGKSPHYIVFVELAPVGGASVAAAGGAGDGMKEEKNQKACKPISMAEATSLDGLLEKNNPIYASFRAKQSISTCELFLVRQGAFQRLREKFVVDGAHVTQVKVPRVLRSKRALDQMWDEVVTKQHPVM